jgi:hypothetical protein
MDRNRFPLAQEIEMADNKFSNSPFDLIEWNFLNKWRWESFGGDNRGTIACVISLKDENDMIKELIQAQKVNVVIEKPQTSTFSLNIVDIYYHDKDNTQVFFDYPTFKDKTTLEYPITPNVNYIGYRTATQVDYYGTDWEKEIAPKLYFKLVEKNGPRWK